MNKICEQVRDLLAHDRGNLNFSPASRYAVSKLCDYAEQEHEQREKAETILCNERRKALAFSAEVAKQERTIDDLRQQLSFLRQALRDAGVHGTWEFRHGSWYCSNCGIGYKNKFGVVPACKYNCCPNCGARMDGDDNAKPEE